MNKQTQFSYTIEASVNDEYEFTETFPTAFAAKTAILEEIQQLREECESDCIGLSSCRDVRGNIVIRTDEGWEFRAIKQ